MNTADLVSNWDKSEIEVFNDAEVQTAATMYKEETLQEWDSLKPLYEAEPMFQGITIEVWLKMYNLACTRCFGWTLPSTMMVPFADFLNHLPIDTQFEVFNLQHSIAKHTDFSQIYTKKFIEDLDPELEIKIRGCPKISNKQQRSHLLADLSKKFNKNMFTDPEKLKVWDQGYVSTDVAEDNDDSSDSTSSEEESKD